MLVTTFASYILIAIFGIFALVKLLSDRRFMFVTILLNVMLGGTMYIVLNFCKLDLPFNVISASFITLLGIPGVILLIILKLVFKFF